MYFYIFFIDSIRKHINLQFSRKPHDIPSVTVSQWCGKEPCPLTPALCVVGPHSLQSDPALPLHGGRLPQEEPVQADGGPGRAGRHRHRGREHPHPAGQGHRHGDHLQRNNRSVQQLFRIGY